MPADASGWIDRRVRAVVAEDLTDLRAQIAALRAQAGETTAAMAAMTKHDARLDALQVELAEVRARAHAIEEKGEALAGAIEALRAATEERGDAIERVRIAIAGLAEQVRWESSDLRQALAALTEVTLVRPAAS